MTLIRIAFWAFTGPMLLIGLCMIWLGLLTFLFDKVIRG